MKMPPWMKLIAVGTVSVALGWWTRGWALGRRETLLPAVPAAAAQSSRDLLAEITQQQAALAQRARLGVVHITSPDAPLPDVYPPNVREALGLSPEVRLVGGLGSGTVIRRDGMILTNEHVVRGIDRLQVILFDGSVHAAQRMAEDRSLDLALLRIDRELTALEWGDSEQLTTGAWVGALGSPYRGLEASFTVGVVSGPLRTLGPGPYQGLVQTSTVIHPGFSGGPLVNERGEVVGIHVAMIGSTMHALSLAIPAHRIRSSVEQMLGSVR